MDENGNFDFDDLANAAFDATVALNDVLEEGLPLHPLKSQRESVRDWCQIGLGVFGVADMLIKMGVRYGSEDALTISRHVASTILNYSALASCTLAVTRGTFPMYDYESLRKSGFYQENIQDWIKEKIRIYGMRNSQLLTIAPTGTLSTMLGVSGGIEPIFANYYTRKTESLHGKDVEYKVYTPIVKRFMEKNDIVSDADLPEYFVTAADIAPIDRVRMQSAWQQYIDASISSTVNLPEEASVDDIAEIYLNAYKYGLKGITVFRNGCRREGILKRDAAKKDDTNSSNTEGQSVQDLPRGFILEASDDLIGKKRKLMTGCGSLHCTAFFDQETGDLMETYLSKGSTGGCNNFMIGLSRMISLAARSGCNIDAIIDQLNSSGICPSYAVRTATKHDTSKGSCCPVAIANALKSMWQEMQDELRAGDNRDHDMAATHDHPTIIADIHVKDIDTNKCDTQDTSHCPECGEPLIHEGGCDICKSCGWSKCL